MTVSEANLQTQWRNVIDLFETTRVYLDDTVGGSTKLLDVIEKSLEGVYTPTNIAGATDRWRATAASLISPARLLEYLDPILFEYAQIISDDSTLGQGFGGGYRDSVSIFTALYEYFQANSLTVESRAITYTAVSAGGSNVGNGGANAMARLTEDENAHNMEACHVEKKRFRCRSDSNTGAQVESEVFEHVGETQSPDDIDYLGSGIATRTFLAAKNAGTGEGGSILRNGSFSQYTSTATPKFTNWTEDSGAVTEETTITYRGHPGEGTRRSCKAIWAGSTITISQPRTAFSEQNLNQDIPYFLRLMVYRADSADGTLTLTWGSKSQAFTVSSLNNSAWNEVVIDFDQDNWFKRFNEDDLTVSISWSGGSTGTLYFDDMLFCPWDLVDGTYWAIRANAATHVPFRVDDYFETTDTGGAAATAKIQYWLFRAGLGYLPHTTGTPTFTEPT